MADETDVELESSTSTVDQPGVTGAADDGQPQDSHPAQDTTTAPPADATPDADAGHGEATPDPVQEAIARLAKPDKGEKPAEQAPSTDEQPRGPDGKFLAKEAAPETTEAAKPAKAEPPKGKVPDAQPGDPAKAEDPLAGFTEAERKTLSTKTTERMRSLLARATAAEAKATTPAETSSIASDFDRIAKEEKIEQELAWVEPKHIAGLVRVQAAINRAHIATTQGRAPARADAEMIAQTFKQIDQFAERFGVKPAAAPAAPALVPHAGELSQAHRDLMEVYGVPEKQVRLLAAIEAREKTAPPPTTAPASPSPATPAAPAPPEQRPEGVDMEALYRGRRDADLFREGVAPERLAIHLQLIQPQMVNEVRRRYPTIQPTQVASVFNALPPAERHEITIAAHRVFKGSGQPPARQPVKPPPTRAPTRGNPATGSRRPAMLDYSGKDAVANAVNYLAAPEE